MSEITAGTVESIHVYARAAAGGALTGSTNLRVQIRRASDGHFLDFNDGTFKGSGWTTLQGTLTEVDSTNEPGWYRYSTGIDTTGWSAGSYYVTAVEITTTAVANGPQFATGEIVIVTATASALSARIPAALVGGRMDASVGAVASGAITATAIADNAITAAKVATGAIDADALASDGVAAIQSGLATAAAVAALPSASSIASSVWGAGTRTLTGIGASGIASQASVDALPTAAGIADAVCDEALSGHTTSDSVGEALGRLDATVSSRLAAASYSAPPSAATIASQVWSTALPGAFSAGSGGYLVGTYLDAAVSTRLAGASYSAPPSASTIASQVLGTAVPAGFSAGTLGYVVGTFLDVAVSTRLAHASYTAPPSAGTVADAVWDEPLAGHAEAGSTGAKLSGITAAPTASQVAAQVWATAEGTPSSGTFGYALWLLRMGLTNRLEESAGNPGLLKLYRDDATTLALTWQLRDPASGAVTAQIGAPAKRGAAA